MATDDVERSEDPTPKRREQARAEGQIAISQDAFVFANLAAVTAALTFTGRSALQQSVAGFQQLWVPRTELSLAEAVAMLRSAFAVGLHIVVPLLVASLAAGIAVGQLQTRGNYALKRLKPRLSKLSPAQNWNRVFRTQGVVEVPKAAIKLALVGGLTLAFVWGRLDEFLGLAQLPLLASMRFQLDILTTTFAVGCAALLVLAAADYAYQHHRHEQKLKMSRSDVSEERRQFEGDPLIKARMRSLQYERARTRMMAAVPKADVIITNPEHVSVALGYERGEMSAPRVLAKGRGLLALRIREIAREAGVPIVENPPLARGLYRAVKIGQEIPERLFQAVAQVLAFVYRLDPRRRRSW
jgi:flagellar biosynthetic protein FlhB